MAWRSHFLREEPLGNSARLNRRCWPGAPRLGLSLFIHGRFGERMIRVFLINGMSCGSIWILSLEPHFLTTVRVALAARDLLNEFGMTGYCKTSGDRGVHVFVRIKPDWEFLDVGHAAIAFGRELERRDKGVTTEWWRELRGARVFVDYNQNCRERSPRLGHPGPAPERRSRHR
jgi:hypothetical protein